ncbi:hypothetical protein [Catellatospora citrea]|uniref:CU044_5270 family protein n=1 Tax=Catellatospora citrea TaxID=53366 RepID=A0A8J3NYT4_9ACTN|nr:hypothetical protein [Catellatospora citrea]RKE09521.1 hypothetical protein C8E86_4411 [Catellatospora citrea]GIF97483.1 hypothetical protein Cci01nite_25770 [Catellatospora citrea]
MTDDPDLRSVREFHQRRSGAAPGALDRVRRRVQTATAAPHAPRVPLPRWAAPAAAAAVVAAVVGGVALLGATGDGTPQPGGPTAGPGRPTSAAPEGAAALWLKYGASMPVAAVFTELDQAAAGTAVAAPRPGELVCSHGTVLTRPGTAPGTAPATRGASAPAQGWVRCFEPAGLIEVPAPGTGDVKGQSPAEQLAAARDGFAAAGPGWGYPTAAWLAALPTDPDLLLAGFRAGTRGPAVVDDLTRWQQYGRFLARVDPLLPAAQRTALHRLMGRLDGLTAAEAFTVSGKRLYAVRLTSGAVAEELVFEPGTGRLAGHVELTRAAPVSSVPASPGGGDPAPVRQELWKYVFEPAATWAVPSATASP